MKKMTNAERHAVADLDKAAYRRKTGLFKAEGTKCVGDMLGSFELETLVATSAWLDTHAGMAEYAGSSLSVVSARELESMSSLKTPQGVLAVFRQTPQTVPEINPTALTLALDKVQDPGNLGTIVRTADWMGVKDIICSSGTVDIYSPKVVMSTMGALARVRVSYCDLAELLATSPVPVCGMALDGEDLYRARLPLNGTVIVMGNEGNGISREVGAALTRRLLIPSYGDHAAESLNVSVATAITLSEFRRRESLC